MTLICDLDIESAIQFMSSAQQLTKMFNENLTNG